MTEIYRNTTKKIYLDVFGGEISNVSATLRIDGELLESLDVVQEPSTDANLYSNNTSYSALIGMQHTQSEKTINIDWIFTLNDQPNTKITYVYDVITPYVGIDDIYAEYPQLEAVGTTVDQIAAMERKVRRIINRYCGQSFGLSDHTEEIIASGGSTLQLPARLLSLQSISLNGYAYPTTQFAVRGGGWALGTPGGYDIYPYYTGTAPIVAPRSDRYGHDITSTPSNLFADNAIVSIKGRWGYERVPGNVVDAAIILIGDYYCSDSPYRDRYIKTIRYADTNIQFNDMAYRGTGNVQADQLLDEYKVTNMVII